MAGPAFERTLLRGTARAFTLLEALMATGILLAVVISVSAAISAGQQHAREAQLRIAASLAAEELLGRLSTQPYEMLPTWHGHVEAPGTMTDMAGNPMPDSFASVGRSVLVTTSMRELEELGIRVRGRTIQVRGFDVDGRILAELSHFIAEPQE